MKIVFLSAFLSGLASSVHCVAMCGGLQLAFGINSKNKRFLFSYHAGRIISYLFLAWLSSNLLSAFGWQLKAETLRYSRFLLALFLFLLALQIIFQWKLNFLEIKGLILWRKLQNFTKQFFPPQQSSDAFILGLFWAVMPCGLIYTTLALAVSSANIIQAMLIMLFFGLGTLPALLILNLFSQELRQFFVKRGVIFMRYLVAGMLIIASFWTLSVYL